MRLKFESQSEAYRFRIDEGHRFFSLAPLMQDADEADHIRHALARALSGELSIGSWLPQGNRFLEKICRLFRFRGGDLNAVLCPLHKGENIPLLATGVFLRHIAACNFIRLPPVSCAGMAKINECGGFDPVTRGRDV